MKTYTVEEIKELCSDHQYHELDESIQVVQRDNESDFDFKNKDGNTIAWITPNGIEVSYMSQDYLKEDIKKVKQLMGEEDSKKEEKDIDHEPEFNNDPKLVEDLATAKDTIDEMEAQKMEDDEEVFKLLGKVSVYERLMGEGTISER